MAGRWAPLLLFAVTAVVAAAVTHGLILWRAPYWATDHQFAEGMKRSHKGFNVLIHAPKPKAGTTSVPLANSDTLGTRAYLDLSKGPLVLTGMRPEGCVYWSASVFTHNTDAALIVSDRDTPDRRIAIGIRRADQKLATPVTKEAVVPDDKAFLLMRCFMRDRTDAAYMADLDQQRRALTLAPAGGGRS